MKRVHRIKISSQANTSHKMSSLIFSEKVTGPMLQRLTGGNVVSLAS